MNLPTRRRRCRLASCKLIYEREICCIRVWKRRGIFLISKHPVRERFIKSVSHLNCIRYNKRSNSLSLTNFKTREPSQRLMFAEVSRADNIFTHAHRATPEFFPRANTTATCDERGFWIKATVKTETTVAALCWKTSKVLRNMHMKTLKFLGNHISQFVFHGNYKTLPLESARMEVHWGW